jgi:SAM-dependent methyltransferase
MKSKEVLIDSYNQLAEVYADKYCSELEGKPFDRELLERFVLANPAGQPICDLGCGPGHIANFLRGLNANALGIDLSPKMIDVARSRYPSVEYREGDMLNLNLLSESLGGIVAFYSIIHLKRHQLVGAFTGMLQVLVPGGGLLVSFHEGVGEHHEEESLGMPIAFDCTLFEPDEVASAMSHAEFVVKEINTRPPYDFEYPTTRVYIWAQKPIP